MSQQHIWREGKFLDVWSLNHFLFGFLSSYLLTEFFHLDLLVSCLIGLFAYIVWEVFEVLIKAGEYPTNQVMDVVVSLVGFWLFVCARQFGGGAVFGLIQPILLCFIALECFGYYSKLKNRKK